ncbi:MAG: hypothetical protein N3D75_00700 [Candidatus Aenigmarchaeota archaeon]|nr:hypothetical protein [Candidatus Aenigmarchaeota archaeon]
MKNLFIVLLIAVASIFILYFILPKNYTGFQVSVLDRVRSILYSFFEPRNNNIYTNTTPTYPCPRLVTCNGVQVDLCSNRENCGVCGNECEGPIDGGYCCSQGRCTDNTGSSCGYRLPNITTPTTTRFNITTPTTTRFNITTPTTTRFNITTPTTTRTTIISITPTTTSDIECNSMCLSRGYDFGRCEYYGICPGITIGQCTITNDCCCIRCSSFTDRFTCNSFIECVWVSYRCVPAI